MAMTDLDATPPRSTTHDTCARCLRAVGVVVDDTGLCLDCDSTIPDPPKAPVMTATLPDTARRDIQARLAAAHPQGKALFDRVVRELGEQYGLLDEEVLAAGRGHRPPVANGAPVRQHPPPPPPAAQAPVAARAQDADTIDALLDRARRSGSTRTANLAKRVALDVERLREMERTAAKKAREREAAARKRAEARAEVARLEEQLAAARAAAGVKRPNPAAAKIGLDARRAQDEWLAGRGVTFVQVRDWAYERGLIASRKGSLLSGTVRAAYDEAHPS